MALSISERRERDYAATRAWRRTMNGVLCCIYGGQVRNSKVRLMVPPDYTRIEFINKYIIDPTFIRLFGAWAGAGYTKGMKPSADRINPLLPYTFGNLQFLTWDGNNVKGYTESRKTRGTGVRMMSICGKELALFDTMLDAEDATGVNFANIYKCCNGLYNTAGGYRWEYTGKGRCKHKDYGPGGEARQ